MRIGLDYYYGRRIQDIGNEKGGWSIELDGDVKIINTDGRLKKPKLPNNGKGLLFGLVTMEASRTTLIFYDDSDINKREEWRIPLSPLSYQIFDLERSEDAWAPQAGGYGKAIEIPPPPHPNDRIADGPTTDDWSTEKLEKEE